MSRLTSLITTYSQFSGLILINFTLELKSSEGNLELCYISRKLRMIVLIFIFKIDVQLFRINIKQFEDIQQAVDVEDKTCCSIIVHSGGDGGGVVVKCCSIASFPDSFSVAVKPSAPAELCADPLFLS